jgi:hypothetical protein
MQDINPLPTHEPYQAGKPRHIKGQPLVQHHKLDTRLAQLICKRNLVTQRAYNTLISRSIEAFCQLHALALCSSTMQLAYEQQDIDLGHSQ